MADGDAGYRTRGKSLDELMDELDRGIRESAGKDSNLIALAFQYRVAKAQERWARISVVIAGVSTIVAIAAVLVAAIE